MSFEDPVVKQSVRERLKTVKEYSYRKMQNEFSDVFAYLNTIPGPNDIIEKLYRYANDITADPVCAYAQCNHGVTPDFLGYRYGYNKYCSGSGQAYSCQILANPKGITSPTAKAALKAKVAIKNAAHRADIKRIIEEGSATCEGCGGIAKFYSESTERWRCVKRVQKCPGTYAKMGPAISEALTGVSRLDTAVEIEPNEGQFCAYGCGLLAKYRLTESCGSKLSCSAAQQGCPFRRSQHSGIMADINADPILSARARARYQATMRQNHGVDWPIQIPGMVAKRREMSQERWGVSCKQLLPGFYEKNVAHLESLQSTAIHEYQLPSSRIIKVRGYEDLAFDDLLKLFSESQIHSDLDPDRRTPRINYLFEGAKRLYAPDFYIPSINTIIEVKSVYTYLGINGASYTRNKLKEQATIAQGYNFVWMIYFSRKNPVLLTLDEIEFLGHGGLKAA